MRVWGEADMTGDPIPIGCDYLTFTEHPLRDGESTGLFPKRCFILRASP